VASGLLSRGVRRPREEGKKKREMVDGEDKRHATRALLHRSVAIAQTDNPRKESRSRTGGTRNRRCTRAGKRRQWGHRGRTRGIRGWVSRDGILLLPCPRPARCRPTPPSLGRA
jgi:hypothetical protein